MRLTARLGEVFVTAVTLSTLAGACLAAEEAQQPATLPRTSGEIVSVDAVGGVLALKESAKLDPAAAPQPTSFLVDAQTVISKDQQPLKLTDLQVGDQVTIEYTTKDGKNVTSSITVQSPTEPKSQHPAAVPEAKSSSTSSVQ
jgi:hypothetical protein